MPEIDATKMGGTMRLGSRATLLRNNEEEWKEGERHLISFFQNEENQNKKIRKNYCQNYLVMLEKNYFLNFPMKFINGIKRPYLISLNKNLIQISIIVAVKNGEKIVCLLLGDSLESTFDVNLISYNRSLKVDWAKQFDGLIFMPRELSFTKYNNQ